MGTISFIMGYYALIITGVVLLFVLYMKGIKHKFSKKQRIVWISISQLLLGITYFGLDLNLFFLSHLWFSLAYCILWIFLGFVGVIEWMEKPKHLSRYLLLLTSVMLLLIIPILLLRFFT